MDKVGKNWMKWEGLLFFFSCKNAKEWEGAENNGNEIWKKEWNIDVNVWKGMQMGGKKRSLFFF